VITIFIPDIPEFKIIVDGARNIVGCTVVDPVGGYWRIEAMEEITFNRRDMMMGPALWNCLLSGGFIGNIVEYNRDIIKLTN